MANSVEPETSPEPATPATPAKPAAKPENRLLTIFRAQFNNKAADEAGRISWLAFAAIIIMVTFITAFPFVNERFTQAFRSTNPELYPGVLEVFRGIGAQSSWDLSIDKGVLSVGKEVPARATIGDWLVLFEPAGASYEAFMASEEAANSPRLIFFGSKNFVIANQADKALLSGGYTALSGFKSSDLRSADPAKIGRYFIYAAATGGVNFTFAMVTMLMLAQDVFLIILLGFLLSLSRVHIAGILPGARRGAGFVSSLKTTCVVSLGPALLTTVLAFIFPGMGGINWIAFTLLFGARVVFVYMGRFKNKPKKVRI